MFVQTRCHLSERIDHVIGVIKRNSKDQKLKGLSSYTISYKGTHINPKLYFHDMEMVPYVPLKFIVHSDD